MCIFHMNEHKILVCMYLCVGNEMCVQILKVNSVKPAIQIFDWFCRDIRWKLRNGNTEAKGNGECTWHQGRRHLLFRQQR